MNVIVVFCRMNMQKLLFEILSLTMISSITLADTTITLDKQQLQNTQQHIKRMGSQAIANIPQASQAISNFKLNQLDTAVVESEIKMAQPLFQNTKPLANKLPNGEKYYLYSESLVSDAKNTLAQIKSPLDINQTISDYNALIKNAKVKLGDSRLLIFISSSMPRKSIINLMQQASHLEAVFVIRGLINGSYIKTYQYFYKLKGDNDIGIMINPTLFKSMQIDSVPTFALYQSDQDLIHTACNITPKYTKVSGEVTVHYALEQLKHSNIAELSQIAANELDILDNSDFYRRNHK